MHPIIQKNRDAIFEDVADQQIEIDLDGRMQANYLKFGDAVAAMWELRHIPRSAENSN